MLLNSILGTAFAETIVEISIDENSKIILEPRDAKASSGDNFCFKIKENKDGKGSISFGYTPDHFVGILKVLDPDRPGDETCSTIAFFPNREHFTYSIDFSDKDGILDKTTGTVNKLTKEEGGGGCLIATATYGSELAPQVQMLREIRDNKVLSTVSGTSFMAAFNSFYYSFSPTIADWERENVILKETVKTIITPLLTSLTVLNYVDIDSEAEMLGYGIGIIMLNVGMYFGLPIYAMMRLRK